MSLGQGMMWLKFTTFAPNNCKKPMRIPSLGFKRTFHLNSCPFWYFMWDKKNLCSEHFPGLSYCKPSAANMSFTSCLSSVAPVKFSWSRCFRYRGIIKPSWSGVYSTGIVSIDISWYFGSISPDGAFGKLHSRFTRRTPQTCVDQRCGPLPIISNMVFSMKTKKKLVDTGVEIKELREYNMVQWVYIICTAVPKL